MDIINKGNKKKEVGAFRHVQKINDNCTPARTKDWVKVYVHKLLVCVCPLGNASSRTKKTRYLENIKEWKE